ncbi:hypothetical protein KSS87_017451 [Heliosperma pusillum]|nr:hypothetical protein KSS87_017451 [Heliosperma pusillum]
MLNPETETTSVVVNLKDPDRSISLFLKMTIKLRDYGYIDPCVFYVRHGLEDCSPAIDVEGPFDTGMIKVSSAVSLGSIAYFFAHNCTNYLIIDFSHPPATREYSRFPCEMIITKLLLVDETIYVFGYKKSWGLCAYTFDLNGSKWESLSLPKLGRLYEGRFVVASLGDKLLALHVDNQLQSVYDPKLKTWNSVDYKGLLSHFCSIVDYPISVKEHNTIYWLDEKANIRAFDYQLSIHYYGPIVGFAHEPLVMGRESHTAPLIHLMGGLFAIVWKKGDTDLHLTLVHISRGPKARSSIASDHHLLVNVVSCFQHHIDPDLVVHGAFKL